MSSANGRLLVPQHLAGQQDTATTRHSHVGRKGDLVVELHYGKFEAGTKRQAAFFIYQVNRQANGVFVPLSHMWAYAERDALNVLIPPLANHVFAFVTKDDCFRLLDAILDFLQDLQKSRPDPELFKDRSLDAFLESCAEEGLEFFTEIGGKKVVH